MPFMSVKSHVQPSIKDTGRAISLPQKEEWWRHQGLLPCRIWPLILSSKVFLGTLNNLQAAEIVTLDSLNCFLHVISIPLQPLTFATITSIQGARVHHILGQKITKFQQQKLRTYIDRPPSYQLRYKSA